MTQITGATALPGRARTLVRPRGTWAQDMATALASGWVVTGMVLDAWAHQNVSQLESFFTPWHAVLYSGFLAAAAWMVATALAGGGLRPLRLDVPAGYGLGLAGAAVFFAAGIGDGIWHTIFGVERDLEAALSPTHIGLFLGALLIFTTPLRSAWANDRLGRAPSFRALLPALLAVTFTTLLVSFLFFYLSAFRNPSSTWPMPAGAGRAAASGPVAYARELGVASVLVTNLLLLAPVLLLSRRWRPPFGTATLLFTTVAFGTSATEEFAYGEVVVAALVGGLVTDWLVARAWALPDQARAFRLVATAAPLALWAAYFLALELRHGVTWPAELWTGSILFACLSGFTLSLLMLPPPAPAGADDPMASGRR
jgi:hypothetical protein